MPTTPQTEKKQDTERAKAARTVKPHENPGPRGNPEIDHASLKLGIDKLKRI